MQGVAQHEAISEKLFEAFSTNEAWKTIQPMREGTTTEHKKLLWFFPVSNKWGHNKDPVILRASCGKIEVAGRTEDHITKKRACLRTPDCAADTDKRALACCRRWQL